jgi:hypothetical protein
MACFCLKDTGMIYRSVIENWEITAALNASSKMSARIKSGQSFGWINAL